MTKKKHGKSQKPVKRLGNKEDDTLTKNDDLICKISLSSPSTMITLNQTKSVKELTKNFKNAKSENQSKEEDENETEEEMEEDESGD